MELKTVKKWTAVLPIVILATIIWYWNTPREMVSGAPYLMLAAAVDVFCLFEIFTVKSQFGKTLQSHSLWSHQRRAQVMLYIALQLAIIGLLNIWSFSESQSFNVFVLSNASIFLSIFSWDRLISLTDDPNQDGGAKPLTSVGRPRSRRLFFWAFFVYPSTAVIAAGAMIFADGKTSPSLFHAPQLGLFLNTLYSVGAAGLILHRYHSAQPDRICENGFRLGGLFLLGTAMGSQFLVGWRPYTNILSALAVVCMTLCTCWLWRASKGRLPIDVNSAISACPK